MQPEEMTAAGLAARAAAQQALGGTLRRRRPLDLALDEVTSALSPRDAGFARAIANETMRRFGQIDDLAHKFVSKPPPPHRAGPTLEILFAGVCELLFLNVPAHAAVDGANRLAAADPKAVHFKPLINAALRRIAREGKSIVAEQDAPRLNTPDWLWTRWCENFGEQATRAIAEVHAQAPQLDLNFSRSTANTPGVRERSSQSATAVRIPTGDDNKGYANKKELPGGIIRLENPGPVDALPGFAEGAFWVQDFAASLPVRLLGDVRDQRVIDLCAAPGGKTAQLASLGADVVAVDRDDVRLRRIAENLDRLHLRARLVSADARDYRPDGPAPFVLLDAPCSATGTVRRHPELPWIKCAGDIEMCADAARELFEAAAAMVGAGGRLIFAVCSIEPEEGREQVDDFLRRHADFRREPVVSPELFDLAQCIDDAGDLRTLPCHLAEAGGMDGFFAARLVRSG